MENPMIPKPVEEKGWQKLGPGVVKINFDAAVQGRRMSFGIVARDHDGFFPLGSVWVFWIVTLKLNGLSCKRWLKAWNWRGKKRWLKLDFESDYANLSIWFTKEEVNFVAIKEGVILVKFGNVDDRKKILNLSPLLFDQCLFSMLAYVKDQEVETYAFNLIPFWVRIFNIPLECMDRQVAMNVGSTIGEVIAINWRDRDGGWTKYIQLRVIIDTSKSLRRVVQFVNSEAAVSVCAIKYERLPIFCYSCGLLSRSTQKCDKKVDLSKFINTSFQYGNWLRAPIGMPN
ncbi:hypothetical protein Gotri_014712 [Gossypium trilobum]|uniref:Zinc knuckle CX2CX4HX4C domain-containing protein n=1 Tax=Gossypium trilobum TaxID=34281 RepID=A0A7J9DXN1_9ROSI|nr:hypothetical protein [Gossypium trilobum]